jgi:hypothetical protein
MKHHSKNSLTSEPSASASRHGRQGEQMLLRDKTAIIYGAGERSVVPWRRHSGGKGHRSS